MPIWILAKKDLRLLLRDTRALVVLLAMPFAFILVLGLALGEGFGHKPDDRLRVSIVNLDRGSIDPVAFREGMAWLAAPPLPGAHAWSGLAFQRASQEMERDAQLHEGLSLLTATATPGDPSPLFGATGLMVLHRANRTPREPWSAVVLRDLEQTGGIRVEMIETIAEAERLVERRERPGVLVFGPQFSERVAQSSFLADGINPFYRDGVDLRTLDVTFLHKEPQSAAAAIIEQVAQVSLMRVVLPWMIGRAFEKLGQVAFIEKLGSRVHVTVKFLGATRKIRLEELLTTEEYKREVGDGVKRALQELFPNYNLTGQTWASLTKSDPKLGGGAGSSTYRPDGSGVLKRGAYRYQVLVPSSMVMFAFFLVLTLGWLFVAERRQGTLRRLQAAPLYRYQILLGKLLPTYLLSVTQGLFLLAAGKLIFDMRWGPQPLWLIPVVLSTSLAAMGMALLVASLARSETQVALYGTLLVLGLAFVSGCIWPRDLMPEEAQKLSLATPHAWALEAYTELLINPRPDYGLVMTACTVLVAFGVGFLLLAWGALRLD